MFETGWEAVSQSRAERMVIEVSLDGSVAAWVVLLACSRVIESGEGAPRARPDWVPGGGTPNGDFTVCPHSKSRAPAAGCDTGAARSRCARTPDPHS